MMIVTKYHDPTTAHVARISATIGAKRVYIKRDFAFDMTENHVNAVRKLMARLNRETSGAMPIPVKFVCHSNKGGFIFISYSAPFSL